MACSAASPCGALPLQGEVDHHDGVLLDDADQHDDADEGIEAQVHPEHQQGEQGPQPRRGQPGQDGQGVDEALVEDAEHQIDHQHGHQEQEPLALERRLEGLGHPLQAAGDRGRQLQVALHRLQAVHRGRRAMSPGPD